MSVKFYMDVHVPRAVTTGLLLRGIDVITAQQEGADEMDDDKLLLRATSLGRVLVSQDADLLREAARLWEEGIEFGGVVFAPQRLVGIGQMVDELTLLATATSASEWSGRVEYLPI